MSLIQTANKFKKLVDTLPHTDNPTQRDYAQMIEAWQTYSDYLCELDDALARGEMEIDDGSVTIKVNDNTIKFDNVDRFADWLAERL